MIFQMTEFIKFLIFLLPCGSSPMAYKSIKGVWRPASPLAGLDTMHPRATTLEHVDSTKYLGGTLQSDCRFGVHISKKIMVAKRQLGMIKRALYWAPERARLIAYKALCLPHLEYASAAWDPASKRDITDIEKVQIDAVRFISNIKGRGDDEGIMEKLGLQPLEQRRKNRRIGLLLKILAKEEQHPALSTAYDDILNQPSNMRTRSQTMGVPRSVGTNSNRYHNSFLPRTIRDLKIGPSYGLPTERSKIASTTQTD